MSLFLAIFKKIALARSQSVREVFIQAGFMDGCLTISHTCLPCLTSRHVSLCVSGVIEGSKDAVWV